MEVISSQREVWQSELDLVGVASKHSRGWPGEATFPVCPWHPRMPLGAGLWHRKAPALVKMGKYDAWLNRFKDFQAMLFWICWRFRKSWGFGQLLAIFFRLGFSMEKTNIQLGQRDFRWKKQQRIFGGSGHPTQHAINVEASSNKSMEKYLTFAIRWHSPIRGWLTCHRGFKKGQCLRMSSEKPWRTTSIGDDSTDPSREFNSFSSQDSSSTGQWETCHCCKQTHMRILHARWRMPSASAAMSHNMLQLCAVLRLQQYRDG